MNDTTPVTPPESRAESAPLILSRAEHSISRKDIDDNALRVLYRLAAFGYRAYLVGGSVRDLLIRKVPKDFDIGTDARPSRIKKIFRNCRIIGRRFRIAHVYFPDGDIIEVSTFRHGTQQAVRTSRGVILRDNEYGTPEEDARRRDITINGLFYDIQTFSVIDYVGGVQDLRSGIIRTISDPDTSFKEDPVRMIRVQRHAARTAFEIEANTLRAIYQNRNEIRASNPARLLEESMKDLRGGAASPFFRLMMETHLLDCILGNLGEQLRAVGPDHPFWRRMETLDRRIQAGSTFTAPVLLSVLLHTVVFPDPQLWSGHRGNPPDSWRLIHTAWREISRTIRISRRDMERVAQIVISYRKLLQSMDHRKLLPSLVRKPYLSEALDFLEIDLESEGRPTDMVKEWRRCAPPPPRPEPRYRFHPARDGEPLDRGHDDKEGQEDFEALPEEEMRDEAGEGEHEQEGFADAMESEPRPRHHGGPGRPAAGDGHPPQRRRRRHRSRRRRGGGGGDAPSASGGSPPPETR